MPSTGMQPHPHPEERMNAIRKHGPNKHIGQAGGAGCGEHVTNHHRNHSKTDDHRAEVAHTNVDDDLNTLACTQTTSQERRTNATTGHAPMQGQNGRGCSLTTRHAPAVRPTGAAECHRKATYRRMGVCSNRRGQPRQCQLSAHTRSSPPKGQTSAIRRHKASRTQHRHGVQGKNN
jgi:hypothetical protein